MGNQVVKSGGPRLRLPTLEIFASESGGAFSLSARLLTGREKRLACEVFERSIDLESVRVVRSPIAAAPTTLGNNIRTRGFMSDAILIHELTHIWQYQNMGTRYISDSLWHQTAAMVSSGSRNSAYNVRIIPNKHFREYTAEHQAVIVERWFRYTALRGNSDYQRLIGEVRSAQPLPQHVRRRLILEEAAYGAGMGQRRLLGPSTREFELRSVPGIPLIRIEF